MAQGQAQPAGYNALILQEIRKGNLALSNKLDTKTAEINESISGLKSMLDNLTSRVPEAEGRIGTTEDHVTELDSRVIKLTKDNEYLMDKIESLENYSRRNNICVLNMREGCEGSDPVTFFANWLPTVLGHEHFSEPLIIERAHRALAQKPSAEERPRAVLICLLKYQDREKILRMAAKLSRESNGPILYENSPVMFFPDLSANVVKRRKEYDRVKKELKSKGIQFALLYPAILRVTLSDGKKKTFKTPKEAATFVRENT
ncbi:hypothetical protein DPEC_G00343200 [Dallia pectoralis]|uniref:Uncharacterized protein n=1 Tax=Dallia pectoralis TaxID=75939 RepID=A0ACC2F2R9_DALPE|nr:hypothetical protein DPEC_G00343200 [Dallia pectoralis]